MESIYEEKIMKKYRINCYSLDMNCITYSENKEFEDDLSAIKYAYELSGTYFNIYILRYIDNNQFVRVAKIY